MNVDDYNEAVLYSLEEKQHKKEDQKQKQPAC